MYTTLLHIETDQQAEDLINEIMAEKAERDRLTDVCQAQIDKYEDKIQEYAHNFENSTKQAMTLLGIYCKEKANKTTKTTTQYALPSGKLQWKKNEPSIVRDNAVLVAWLNKHARQYVKVIEEPKWSDVKKAAHITGNKYEMCTNDGELLIIDGVELQEPEESETFEIKTGVSA
jgi:seryl-tRNA synthetase